MKSRKRPIKIAVTLSKTSFLQRQETPENDTFFPKSSTSLPAVKGGCHLWLTMF
jgi:hypothetical protein